MHCVEDLQLSEALTHLDLVNVALRTRGQEGEVSLDFSAGTGCWGRAFDAATTPGLAHTLKKVTPGNSPDSCS